MVYIKLQYVKTKHTKVKESELAFTICWKNEFLAKEINIWFIIIVYEQSKHSGLSQ